MQIPKASKSTKHLVLIFVCDIDKQQPQLPNNFNFNSYQIDISMVYDNLLLKLSSCCLLCLLEFICGKVVVTDMFYQIYQKPFLVKLSSRILIT